MFAVLDLITGFIYSLIGNGVIMVILIMASLVLLLMAMRANVGVILVVLIPVMLGFILNTAGSEFIQLATWSIMPLMIMAGFIFAGLFIFYIR